jgi:nucleotide-binding universal stress UspA family protein
MLRMIDTGERNQQWMGVADIMKAEALEAANKAFDKFAARVKDIANIIPDRVIREGEPSEEIVKLIDEDTDIGILVLAAGTSSEGPGPLVSSLAKNAGTFPIPVAIVPGQLSDEDIDASS